VDSTFIQYYTKQIEDLLRRIDDCRQQGRTRLIELLEPKLKRYTDIKKQLER
jgi:hypothetical protein